MLNQIKIFLAVVVIATMLIACSATTTELDISTNSSRTQQVSVPTLSTTLTPLSTPSIIASLTKPPNLEISQETVTSEPTSVPHTTPTAMLDEEPSVLKSVSCQDLPKISGHDLAGTGYVLYYTRDTPGIGTISLDNFSQQQLFESLGQPAYGAELSPDGNTITFHQFEEDLILLNLMTGMTMSIPFDEAWVLATPNWSQDGRIIAHTTGDVPLRFYFLDPLTLDVAEKKKPPYWPEVYYLSMHGFPGSGFIITDPTETFAVYTEQISEPGYAIEINYVLRNVQDGRELWRTEDIGYEYHVEPIWDEVGNQFLLALPETQKRDYTLILGLTQDGQEIEIARISQLPGVGADFEIRYLEVSHDQRYIHFGLFETIETGLGYILDTHTHTIYEICEPNFVQGWWLPGEAGGYLAYLADRESGERALKLLDVTTWQDKELLVTDMNFDPRNVIGWTSAETP